VKEIVKYKETMNNTEFYLVRHAQSEANLVGDKIGGVSYWAELTYLGKQQAHSLGVALKNVHFDHYYTSDVIRTQQTARYCLVAMDKHEENAKVKRDANLVELKQGDWEGENRDAIYGRDDVKMELSVDNWNFVPGHVIKGESQNQCAQRMVRWMHQKVLEHSNERILIFTHGLAIKYLLAELFNRDRHTAYQTPIDNASVTVVNYEDGIFTCSLQNDISHLNHI
jgi:probable phosphoglycerate mutase